MMTMIIMKLKLMAKMKMMRQRTNPQGSFCLRDGILKLTTGLLQLLCLRS